MFQTRWSLGTAERGRSLEWVAPADRAGEQRRPGGALQHRRAGSTFILLPDVFWAVQSGALWIIERGSGGHSTPLALLGPQMVFNYPLVAPPGCYLAQAETDVELWMLEGSYIQRSTALSAQINAKLVDSLLHMEAWQTLRQQASAVEQLRDFLLLMAEQFGRPEPRGVRLELHLTHAQIGTAIGKERLAVNAAMGRLRADNWIHEEADGHLLLDWGLPAARC